MRRSRWSIVDRDEEVKLLADLLEGVVNAECLFVVVSGEAGIGKSRLLQELAAMADKKGYLTFEGRAAEFESEIPFRLFVDALDAHLSTLDPEVAERLAIDRLGALARVFPSLGEVGDSVEYPPSATERFRVHHAVRELLERLAARRPVVLILDDLHWADSASVELISYLLRHPPQAEVILALALRLTHGDRYSILTGSALQSPAEVQSIELVPLGVDGMRTLVGDDAERVHHLSGGNPFYALEIVRAGLMNYDVVPSRHSLDVPRSVAHAVERELAEVSIGARIVAASAAVIGDPFDVDILASSVERSEDEVMQAIDELVLCDLIRETAIPRRFEFRHPIVRSAVYASNSPSVRVNTHRLAGQALLDEDAPLQDIAFHIEQSAVLGDSEAVAILRSAGEDAAHAAPLSAIRWFEAAMRIMPASAPPQERVSLLESRSASLAVLGRFDEALSSLQEALSTATAASESTSSLIVACADLEQLVGRFDASRSRLEKAYQTVDDKHGSPDGISLAIALSRANLQLANYPDSLKWGQLAAESAETSQDQVLRAAALSTQAMSAALAGDIGMAKAVQNAATRLVDSLSDDELTLRLDALTNLAVCEMYVDLFPEAVRHGLRCLTLARESGQTQLLPILAPVVGTCLWVVGELALSAEVLDDAIEAARLIGNGPSLAWQLLNRAFSANWAGEFELARRFAVESVEIADVLEDGLISSLAGACHGMVLLELGESAEALNELITRAGGIDLPLIAGGWRPMYLELETRCYLALDMSAEARDAADRAREEAEGFGLNLSKLMADRAEVAVAQADGRFDDAVSLAMSAVALSTEIGARVFAASARLLAGRALVAASRVEEAVEQLTIAAEEFESMGATRHRDQTEAQLRGIGVTVHRRTTRGRSDTLGVDALTGREIEVVELVVDHRTNREIAETLFLSTKTVETHMRNIFNKLGVSSRAEVARTMVKAREMPTTV